MVDSLLSETRDLKAARCFFRGARAVVGHAPDRVTTDGRDAYPRAIRGTLGRKVVHRRSRYVNNRLCTAHEELRDYFRSRRTQGEVVTLAEQRQLFRERWSALMRRIAV